MNAKEMVLRHLEGHAGAIMASAPGRVNLIGEHTDYNGGLVLPIAIDARTYVGFLPDADSDTTTVSALDWNGETLQVPVNGPFDAIPGGGWKNYVLGVMAEMKASDMVPKAGQLFIAGDIPQGAGLSSSASLEIALVQLFSHLNQRNLTPLEAALIGQAAEHNHAGCACGLMDQWVSAGASEGHALLIDCGQRVSRPVVWPEEYSVLVIDSKVRRKLAESGYNDRRNECETAARALGVETLSDVSLDLLEGQTDALGATPYKRARHVVSENERTRRAVVALETNDFDCFFQMVRGSHASLREDFEVTVPETDFLADLMNDALGGEGAARMTGGGFGGCVIALAPTGVLEGMVERVLTEYERKTGLKGESFLFRAGPGPGAWEVEG